MILTRKINTTTTTTTTTLQLFGDRLMMNAKMHFP